MGGRGEKGTARDWKCALPAREGDEEEISRLANFLGREEAEGQPEANGPDNPPRKASSQWGTNRTANRHR